MCVCYWCDTVDNIVSDQLLQDVLSSLCGTYLAPIITAVPEQFHQLLPAWFLDAAAVYADEDKLTNYFQHIFVHGGLGKSFEINYECEQDAVCQLKQSMTPALFDLMLSYGLFA